MSLSSPLVVIPVTIAVSAAVIYGLDSILETTFRVFVLATTAELPVPPQFKNTASRTIAAVTVPAMSFCVYLMIQQIAELCVATPLIMSSISTLEAAPQSPQVIAAKNRIIIARQTLIRTSIFLSVAGIMTARSMLAGLAVPDLDKTAETFLNSNAHKVLDKVPVPSFLRRFIK
jgi:hypothetical protein